ncbi:hypothetical protein Aple_096250 [Acrocarpospora pleiomorpha]|uniref:Uncharacterized protein n=1 Tax=Acrocarpospora pleiomorpha TaxID=90975 RepID=A0A5M3Y0L4_9ACTN|nr:hypothetical protein [Acrocarpospora pleiomorpha]GES26726.1 hypothetical protein Aple_096250 [Acrocarpospora pleiomorpha]
MLDELDHVIDLCARGSFSEVSADQRHLAIEDRVPGLLATPVRASRTGLTSPNPRRKSWKENPEYPCGPWKPTPTRAPRVARHPTATTETVDQAETAAERNSPTDAADE